MKPFLYIIVLSLFIISCKKETDYIIVKKDIPPNPAIIYANYLFNKSSQWLTRDSYTEINYYPPYNSYHDEDTILFYFDGDTTLDRFTVFAYDSVTNNTQSYNYDILHYYKKKHRWNLLYEDHNYYKGTIIEGIGSLYSFLRNDDYLI